ncbi:restriction endonuclease subunit S [Spirosoma jeollabukense]
MKQTKIGEIPEDWEVVKLGKVATINQSSLPNGTDADYTFWYIDLSAVKQGEINFPLNQTRFGDSSPRARRKMKHGDVLVSTVRPNLLGYAIANFDTTDVICSTGFAIVSPNTDSVGGFIYQLLYSETIQLQISKLTVGSNYPAINTSDVSGFLIPLPPLAEQQKIAEILSTVDEKMAVIDEQLAKTAELKTGLMQRLLTKGIGHTTFKDSPLGEIPESWEVMQLGDVLDLINGKAFQPSDWGLEGLPIIRIQNLNNSNAPFNYYSGLIEDRYYVHSNDILFAWSGTKGVSFGARIWKGDKAVLNQHIFRVVPDQAKIDYDFAYIILKQAQAEIETKAHGFKSSFVHVKKSDITKLAFILPPLGEQRQIAELLTTVEEKIQVLRDKKEHYQTLKRGLMQQLLTGKLRVRVTEDAVPA